MLAGELQGFVAVFGLKQASQPAPVRGAASTPPAEQSGGTYKVGNPYVVNGVTYSPVQR